MDGRVDFPLERGRLLAPTLPSGSLAQLGSAYTDNPTLGRPTMSDITRAGTPSSIPTLGHYPSRYMPPPMSVHSQGASFALMGGYLSGSGHASEGLKSLMPEVQQYWGPAHTDGYPRYVINNNLLPPYPFPIGAESLPLLPGGLGGAGAPTQQSTYAPHRIYELHKDPYLTNPAVSQAGYFSLPGNPVSLPSRPSSPIPPGVVAFKQEAKFDPSALPERPSKHAEKRSHSLKHDGGKSSECKHGRGDSERRDAMESRSETKESHKADKVRSKRSDTSVDTSHRKQKAHDAHDCGEKQKETIVEEKNPDKTGSKQGTTVVTSSGNVKTQSITTLPTVTVTASGTTVSHSTSAYTGSTHSVFTCVQPVTVATTQGSQISPIKSVNAQGKTASALPYYHNMYSHPSGSSPPPQGKRKVYATTFVPEVGTVNGPLEKSIPRLCETRVKSETVRPSCCREKQAAKIQSCHPSSESATDRSTESASKHSSKTARRHPSGDPSNKMYVDSQKTSPVSSSAECGDARAELGQGKGYESNQDSGATHNKKDSVCEAEALDYTTASKTGRVCPRHQVKTSPTKAVAVSPSTSASRLDQKVSAQVQPSAVTKPLECPSHVVTSSSPDTKPDSTTQQEQGEHHVNTTKQEKVTKHDSGDTDAALNLTKTKKSAKVCDTTQKRKERTLLVRKSDVPIEKEKRCGSAPPQTAVICSSQSEDVEIDPGTEQVDLEEHHEKVEEPQEHTGGNIPVGIAVARQRAEQPRGQDPHGARAQAPPPDGSSRGLGEEDDPSRQYSQDREEFLRQQKAILSGQAKVTVNTGLPPNLVVTGSVAGNDPSLQDDPRVRPMASQWVTAGHTVNPNPWLAQNPFALHPAITTTSTTTLDPNPFPATAPSGFKIAQDSFTGNLFLIPADYVDQGGGLWPFPGSHGPQPPPTHFQHLLQTSPHIAQLHPSGSPAQLHEEQSADTPDHTPGSRQTPDSGDQREESERGSEGQCASRGSTPGSRPTSGSGKEKTPTPQSPPDTPNSPQDREKPINLSNPYIPDMAVAAQQYTYPYTAGHLPYMFNPGLIPVPGMPVNLSEPLTVKTEPPTVQSRGTSPMVLTPPPSDETNRVEEPTFKEASVYADFPRQVTKCCASVQTCDPPPPSITLKEQCSQTCQELDLSRTETLLKAAEKLSKLTDSASQSEPDRFLPSPVQIPKSDSLTCRSSSSSTKQGSDYNPFTDPLILKAADGLELLSALAERRSQCSNSQGQSTCVLSSPPTPVPTPVPTSCSTNPTVLSSPTSLPSALSSPTNITNILPSPSDSFQSDNYVTCEETSSVDADRPGDTTPKRDIRRGAMSPKWTFPKKDPNPSVLTIGGIKIPTGLDSMDAMEVEMRMRLAELQRRYKEKQRELAKLQPRVKDGSGRERRESRDSRDDDPNSAKRKPGRPRKRKFFTKKKDEESPNKSVSKESHPKKKRLPEELVDRVFRKLPPVKSDKLKTMRTKSGFFLKRRSSSSSAKSSQDTSSGDGFLCKSSTFGERKFFKSKGANIAKGKFKPFAKKKEITMKEEKPSISSASAGSDSVPDTGNLFSNIENSLAEKKRPKTMLKGIERQCSKEFSDGDPSSTQAVSPSMLESGLGLLAKFATSALSANIKKKKRKLEEASDTETSDTPSTNKKRKPGRPKKCTPISTGGGTETIVAKKSKTLGLLHLADVVHGNKDKKTVHKTEQRQVKLDGSQQLKPLYLDEDWCLRRSERIFLSEPSPQPSPNNQQPGGKQETKMFFTPKTSKVQSDRDRDRAKVQKAKSLQELSQKVKRKYSKNMNRKTSFGEDRISFQRGSIKAKLKETRSVLESESDQSGSEGDDIPLSALRRRPDTPEPRSCVMCLDDLKEQLRVLEFQDGLFYEGAVKAINPPDIYGVVIDNQRGNRPHIYPQEEILKNVIVDVKPGSPRFLPEGTRVCAYWSQQFSCLYPGTVAKTSPNPHADKYSVNVEFDDGDSGRIPIDHIRLLPDDFPLVSYDPNPLLNLSKRRRRTTSDDSEFRKSSDGYFSLSESKKRNSKRDTFSSGQFDETLEEEDSEDPDVFEADVRKKSNDQRDSLHETSQSSPFSKGFQNSSMATLSPRREKSKTSSLIRPSAFDIKKLGFQYGVGSGPEDDSSSDEDMDSTEDECNETSGGEESDPQSLDEGEGQDMEDKTKKVGRKTASKNAVPKKKRSEGSQNKGLAGFLPARQLWKWSGKSTKRPGLKGKAKKEFYKAIVRGKELIKVGDCAVFLSTGRPNLPFIGRIESMWESWGGQMTVKVKWFYHPEETKGGKKLADPRGALFESPHEDENDVQTISHKCEVQTIYEFKKRNADVLKKTLPAEDMHDFYYLAGYYDPTIGLVKYEADVL